MIGLLFALILSSYQCLTYKPNNMTLYSSSVAISSSSSVSSSSQHIEIHNDGTYVCKRILNNN